MRRRRARVARQRRLESSAEAPRHATGRELDGARLHWPTKPSTECARGRKARLRPEPLDARLARAMKRLLLVDDDDDMRSSVRELLVANGFVVDEASSGPVALERLHGCEALPSLVLLDMAMPGMSGLDVLAELSATPKLSGLVVVLFTAHPQAVPPPGARALIRKPIDADALLMLVEKFCRAP